ncbi:hypothetical protein BD289DRAFT_358624 [Coniella lustricola]|uniref:Uncharacterized protein n=1 Tax=Coniella lustricola TaxID=2025994 RepID=A0A2T3AN99_9PEZI|nr:hypothetical protein BD289DRAFT_358624 [Coniella lustricola]
MADNALNHPTTPGSEPGEEATPKSPSSMASKLTGRVRSLSKGLEELNPPAGFMAATSGIASSALVGERPRRRSSGSNLGTPVRRQTFTDKSTNPAPSESIHYRDDKNAPRDATDDISPAGSKDVIQNTRANTDLFGNGYHFPPSYPRSEALKHGLITFLRYSITPMGFLVVLYGLNVVAWGGMLFLLLCNASPAMCYPSCNDIDSPRRKWVEYDSQVLTALFSLTAFGLAPWRFRDLYYLLKYRILRRQIALRKLAGIHRDWFRLPGSSVLPLDVGPLTVDEFLAQRMIPETLVTAPTIKIPDPPLTGVRASPTAVWKLDFVIWMMVWNTLFQCVLSGVMWGMNRYTRPSWSTGLFVALGCIVAAVGGILMFVEGKKVKGIEGVPLTDRDRERLARDRELGITHYNNIKDKAPVEEEKKKKTKTVKRWGWNKHDQGA